MILIGIMVAIGVPAAASALGAGCGVVLEKIVCRRKGI